MFECRRDVLIDPKCKDPQSFFYLQYLHSEYDC